MIKVEVNNKELETVKNILSEFNLPPENALAFSGTDSEIHELMETIRIDSEGHSYFFVKKEKDLTILISIVKIKNIGIVFEKVKERIQFNHVNTSISQKSNFSPTGITFGG